MARLEDAAAAARLNEAEFRELLAVAADPPCRAPQLAAKWLVDEQSGCLTLCWFTTLQQADAKPLRP